MLIQLGAILALLSIYFVRLWHLFLGMFNDPEDRRFVIGVLVAFLPAMVIGALAYGIIKSVLFNVWIVCAMLVIGGIVLLWIDRLDLKPRYHDATKFTLPMYLGIGVMPVPVDGARRVALRRDHRRRHAVRRRQARRHRILVLAGDADHGRRLRVRGSIRARPSSAGGNALIIAIGFAVSFICGWFVVKTLLGYVSRHGFALFAWWRIAVGALGLIALALGLLGRSLMPKSGNRFSDKIMLTR